MKRFAMALLLVLENRRQRLLLLASRSLPDALEEWYNQSARIR